MNSLKVIIRIEADTIGGNSKVFQNGIQLSQEEIDRSEILYDMTEDDSYLDIYFPQFDKCYKHINEMGYTTYIIYGNVNEKDECNRRLAYSALLEGKQIDESSLLKILSVELKKINYSLCNSDLRPSLYHDASRYANNTKVTKGLHVKLSIFSVAVIIIFIILILIFL